MKILLRNTKTRLYASGTGQWVKSRAEAHDFGKSPQAYQHAKEHQLENAEVVFLHDDFKEAFTLPARSFSPPLVKVNEPVKAVTLTLGDDFAGAKTLSITPHKFPSN